MFSLWCNDWIGSLYANRMFMYVLGDASGPRVKLASCRSSLNPTVVCYADRSKAVVPVLVLLLVAFWFILRGDLLYVFPCVILFLCFSVLLVLRLPRLGKRELILVLFVRLFGLCLFRFVGFLFLLESGKGCGLWLWHSLDFSLTFFARWVANNVEPDRTPQNAASDTGLHCLLRSVCPNTWGKYVIIYYFKLMIYMTYICQRRIYNKEMGELFRQYVYRTRRRLHKYTCSLRLIKTISVREVLCVSEG